MLIEWVLLNRDDPVFHLPYTEEIMHAVIHDSTHCRMTYHINSDSEFLEKPHFIG